MKINEYFKFSILIVIILASTYIYGCGKSPVASSSSSGGSSGSTSSSWESLAGGMDKPVNSIAFDKAGNLYAGGTFTKAGVITVSNIAKWDGTKWDPMIGGTNGTVNFVIGDDLGNVFVCGNFTSAGGVAVTNIARWKITSSWEALGDPGGEVTKMFLLGPNYYILVSGCRYVKKWDSATSAWVRATDDVDSPLYDIAVTSSGNIYAGGAMLSDMTGTLLNKIGYWNGTSWESMDSGADNYVNRVMLAGSTLYAGGVFKFVGSSSLEANKIAKWSGSSWEAMGTGLDNSILALCSDTSGNIYAGGMFNNAGSTEAKKIAKWDGARWAQVGDGFGATSDMNAVRSIAFNNSGKLYAAGDFVAAGGATVNYIAKLK